MSTQQTRKAVAIPEPSGTLAEPWSAGKLWRMLALFGPAAIVASVSIGAGETIVFGACAAKAGASARSSAKQRKRGHVRAVTSEFVVILAVRRMSVMRQPSHDEVPLKPR